MFLCPVCGKQNSIEKYRPENFDDDIEIFHNASLGYRKGFEKVYGFDLSEFPELRMKLTNRIIQTSKFLEIDKVTSARIEELENTVGVERNRRVSVEETLEELDLEYLLTKVNQALGEGYSDTHSAVDELISRAFSIRDLNLKLSSTNQSLQSRCTNLEQINTSLTSEKNRLIKENNKLRLTLSRWEKAYHELESQKNKSIAQYSAALIKEQKRRTQLQDKYEELDLGVLLESINKKITRKHNDLHSAVNELVQANISCEREIQSALDFINNTVLPEAYDLFDDLGEALEAVYHYYEDQIEELSDV